MSSELPDPIDNRMWEWLTMRLDRQDQLLQDVLREARKTNGSIRDHEARIVAMEKRGGDGHVLVERVDTLEQKVAVLDDREDRVDNLHERIKEVESRGRLYLMGIGGPVIAAVLTLLLSHA